MPKTAVEQMREAIEDGTCMFWPPWLGDVLVEIADRLETLEAEWLEAVWAE